ncbi:MAG: hypothetical protein VYB35_11760 [Verrucomicrobiota bacterium]|jgi:hypothetical protein|nr:hypothetical protein [Verrucomicrobiota bacterium]|tara:strand:+ start:257 stop:571 length:315 start_codon:yes stop_codon:yes gene_type:complete
MINSFVNTILAITGMAVILSLGILNMVTTEPHGFALGILWLVVSLVIIGLLTVLYTKKAPTGWIVLLSYTLILYLIGGPHLFTFGMLGFSWAFAKIGCLTTDEH